MFQKTSKHQERKNQKRTKEPPKIMCSKKGLVDGQKAKRKWNFERDDKRKTKIN